MEKVHMSEDISPSVASVRPLSGLANIHWVSVFFAVFLCFAASPSLVFGDDEEGSKTLQEATAAKLSAQSPRDFQKVIELCEEALEAGLSDSEEKLAKRMLAATALQRAQFIWEQFPRLATNRNSAIRIGESAIADLKKATKANTELPEAFMLLGEIQAKLLGDMDEGKENVSRAIELYKNNPARLADAYILRGRMQEDGDDKMKDFNAAVEADNTSDEAWQSLIGFKIARGELQEAVDDAKKLLDEDAENQFAVDALFRSLVGLRKYEEAIQLKSAQIADSPENAVYFQERAGAYRVMSFDDELSEAQREEALEKSLADLNKSVEFDDANPQVRLSRAQLFYLRGDFEKAQKDVDASMAAAPTEQGLQLRSMIAGAQGRVTDAIVDMERLVNIRPTDLDRVWQLSNYYQMDDRPRKAIELLNAVLKVDPKQWRALRSRGDAKLSVGEHAEAIKDYEAAYEIVTDDDLQSDDVDYSGLLNNLAWVLATSTKEEIRDGKRALELAQEACEETDFKAAHILSTLAAAHAEVGDFENARKWAKKAVTQSEKDADDPEQLKHLKDELESYKKDEKWREKQDIDENDAPIDAPLQTIDT